MAPTLSIPLPLAEVYSSQTPVQDYQLTKRQTSSRLLPLGIHPSHGYCIATTLHAAAAAPTTHTHTHTHTRTRTRTHTHTES
jgi:hypothetical protein